MPRKLPPHCESFRDRHGRLRIYFRRDKTKPRVALPCDPTSPEFMEAYAAALAGLVAERKKPELVKSGTIAALIASYRNSGDWRDLRETTRVGYAGRLKHLADNHGHRSLSGMDAARINDKILRPFMDRPGQRLAILKMLRVLVRHGIAFGLLKADPTLGIKRPRSSEIRSWTEDEIALFQNRWPLGTAERTALDLHLYTGQRRSDVHRMTWADVRRDGIAVVQQKTAAKLVIPVHPELAKTLTMARREHLAIITTRGGSTYTVDSYSAFLRAAIAAAGLPLDCQPHGLRKAAGRRLAEAGCSAKQIMAVLGHKTLAEAERYTREAEQFGLAQAAIDKLSVGRKENRNSQTIPARFGKIGKTEGKTNR